MQGSDGNPLEKQQKIDGEIRTPQEQNFTCLSAETPQLLGDSLHCHVQPDSSYMSIGYPIDSLTPVSPLWPPTLISQTSAKVRRISEILLGLLITHFSAAPRPFDRAERHTDIHVSISSHGLQVLVTGLLGVVSAH